MITIAWDVDDVLNDLMRSWLVRGWVPKHPGCILSFEQITQNTPERILNCTREEYQESLDNFRLSGEYLDLEPDRQLLSWFKQYGHQVRHIALTAVPLKAAHISAGWVMNNFGQWIRSFNFIPSLREGEQVPEYDLTKADYLKRAGNIDILVEDSPVNIAQAQVVGIKGLLLKKPWNKSNLTLKDALTEINGLIARK